MRRYLPYLLTAALIVLAVCIVATRPGPPGLSAAELANLRAKANSMPRETLQAALERWIAETQPHLPKRLIWDRSIRAATIRDLTVEVRLRLGSEESDANTETVIEYFDKIAAEICQEPNSRLILEADAVVVTEIERVNGRHIVTYRLSKDSCRE